MRFLVYVLLALVSPPASAQDVYNFYFQKNAPPQSVEVSGDAKPIVVGPAPQAPIAYPEVTVPTPPRREKRWQLNAGYGSFSDEEKSAEGFTIGGEFNFNRYWGIQGQLMTGKGTNYYPESRKREANPMSGALGLKVTPFHMSLFGLEFIEFSALAGVMSATRKEVKKWSSPAAEWSGYSGFRYTDSSTNRFSEELMPYLGAAVTVHLDEHLSATLQGKRATDAEGVYHAVLAAAYRF